MHAVLMPNSPNLSNTVKAHMADTIHVDSQRYIDKESWGVSQERRRLLHARYRIAFLRKRIASRMRSSNYLKSRASKVSLKASASRTRRPTPDLLIYSVERFSKRTTRINLKYFVESEAGSLQTPQDRPEYLNGPSISLNPIKSKFRHTINTKSNPATSICPPIDPLFVKVKPVEISQVSLLSRMIQTRQSSTLEKNAERRRLLKAMRRHSMDVSGGVPDISGSRLLTDFEPSTKRRCTLDPSQFHFEAFFESSINVW